MRPTWQQQQKPGSGTPVLSSSKKRDALLLLLAFLAVAWFAYATGLLGPAQQYVLIIDAGSSGTRMNAYRWHPAPHGQHLPRLEALPPGAAAHKVPRRSIETRRAYQRVETEPGLDKFAENPTALGPQALEPLLEWARAAVPSASWASTPVFLLGTAGMRKLKESEREAVLGAARGALAASGFRFESPWARVLGGSDEGVLAWVALNAALGTLGTPHTVGALDLGGSSLQVTFAMDGGSGDVGGDAASAPAVNVSILGAQHALYTHSHYHFGLDDAFERSVTLLLEQKQQKQQKGGKAAAGGKDAVESGAEGRRRLLDDKKSADKGIPSSVIEIEHPCLAEGYREQYHRIPIEGRAPVPEEVILVGRPNAKACEKLAHGVVTAKTACSAPPCALGAPQPRAAGRFVALAGFYVVAHFFELGASTGVSAVRAAGREFCPRPWSAVTAAHDGEMAIETYCFRSEYVHALVSKGLGLSEDQVEIGEGSAGWTLGAALLEGHRAAGLGAGAPVGGGRRLGLGAALPNWGGRAAALLLAAAAAAAMLLAFRRAAEAARAVRGGRRRTSSGSNGNGVLSAADYLAGGGGGGAVTGASSAAALNGSGGSASGDAFYRLFGQPPSIKGGGEEPAAAMGSSRSSLSRSATFARRLSALENGASC